MAETPDPKSFKSWEDAFQYPIPTVRRMGGQLRNDVAANRERLRTLVGFVPKLRSPRKTQLTELHRNSYRDLLGTAEAIVHMDGDMQQTESYLADVGRRCNAHLLEKSLENLDLVGKARRDRGGKHR